jgi:hypothetical protein
VVRARRFLTALDRAGGDPGHPRLGRSDPQVSGAVLLWRGEPRRRREAEARLLAGQSDDEVAGRLGIAAGVVEAYENLFYAVRDRLEAADWDHFQAIGPRLYEGYDAGDLEIIWKLFAFNGGPRVLDALLATFPGGPAHDTGPAADPRPGPLFDLAVGVATLSVTAENTLAVIRLDTLARRLGRAEAARSVAPVTRPVVTGTIRVDIKSQPTGIVPAAPLSADLERPWDRGPKPPTPILPDHLDAEGRILRPTG